jgi:hypothetical protein
VTPHRIIAGQFLNENGQGRTMSEHVLHQRTHCNGQPFATAKALGNVWLALSVVFSSTILQRFLIKASLIMKCFGGGDRRSPAFD